MTYRVVLQPRAERDIRSQAFWLLSQSDSPAVALRWSRGIRAKLATLEANPSRCPIDPDSEAYGEEVRVLLYGKKRGVHRILFAIRGHEVHVLTVRHTAQRSLPEEMELDEEDDG
jgi:plasmid stabilization system protein ParE